MQASYLDVEPFGLAGGSRRDGMTRMQVDGILHLAMSMHELKPPAQSLNHS